MRLLPRTMFDDMIDDWFGEPRFTRRTAAAMRCDIREKDGSYLLDIELPGYRKEDIHIDLEDGYLTVSPARNTSSEEKDKQGNILRQEGISGRCSPRFYVGVVLTNVDIKAKYDNGELKIVLPKKDQKEIEAKKNIMIE